MHLPPLLGIAATQRYNIESPSYCLFVSVVYRRLPLTAARLLASRKPKRSTFFAVAICFMSLEKPRHISSQHSPQMNLPPSSLRLPLRFWVRACQYTKEKLKRPRHIRHFPCFTHVPQQSLVSQTIIVITSG